MKSLDQIEARTPISSVPFTISASGSYYVTTNLTAGTNQSGIVVAADNVTIDLNGFTLFGGGGSVGEGVATSGARTNVVVRNGTLRNWPGSGVNFYDSNASQTLVQNIQSISNTFSGVAVKNGSRVLDCLTVGNGTKGIVVDNDSLVEHCKASGNTTAGIAAVSNCELKENMSTGNGTGLNLTGTNNIVANNTVKANTDNYNIVQGNQLDLLLCEVPESIDWPARVKLAGSLKVTAGNAVTITASGVTLDLNGFTLSSTEASPTGTAVQLNSGLKNITITNGFIQGSVTESGGVYSGSGFANGIFYVGTQPVNVLISRVSVSGCLNHGINLNTGDSTVVENCNVRTVGMGGIRASTIKASSAADCGSNGIWGDQVSDCLGACTGGADGIVARTALNCYGISSSSGYGVLATVALNCYGTSDSGYGISAGTAQNCFGVSFSGFGVVVNYTAQNCFGSSGSSNGIYGPIAIGCSAAGSPAFSPTTHQYFCGSGVNPYP